MTEHLGGYIEGGDPGTWYPDLWTWLVQEKGARTVIDLGCGEGHSTRFFHDLGCRVCGIDGAYSDRLVYRHDFTEGPLGALFAGEADLVWCCEFVEHVEERYAHNFVSVLQQARLVLMTHAFPGQGGHHHVNCQPPTYWIGFMAAAGFVLSEALTAKTRELAEKNATPWNHYARSGMAFVRREP